MQQSMRGMREEVGTHEGKLKESEDTAQVSVGNTNRVACDLTQACANHVYLQGCQNGRKARTDMFGPNETALGHIEAKLDDV